MTRKFIYPESRISELTGLSRTVLKKFREKSIPKTEWKKGKSKGKPVLLAEVAVDRIKLKFGIEDANLDEARIKGSSESQPARDPQQEVLSVDTMLTLVPDLKLLTVSALPINKRLVFAKNGTGDILQVIVPSNLVWSIGDPLRAKVSEKHNGYYELIGKAPRWRGDRIYRHEFV